MSAQDTPDNMRQQPKTSSDNSLFRGKWSWLAAPLMVISLLFHVALLFVPLPTPETTDTEPEEEDLPEEETPEILSLAAIEIPEPPPPEQPQQPPEQAPPPSGGTPPPPDPEQLPENLEELPQDDGLEELTDPLDLEDGSFDAARQEALVGGGRQNLGASEFGSINSDPGLIVAFVQDQGLQAGVNQDCFLAGLDPQIGLIPVENALDVMLLTNNADFVPGTLCNNGFCTDHLDAGNYCGAPLYELRENGIPQFYVSVVEIGNGGSALAILWGENPNSVI